MTENKNILSRKEERTMFIIVIIVIFISLGVLNVISESNKNYYRDSYWNYRRNVQDTMFDLEMKHENEKFLLEMEIIDLKSEVGSYRNIDSIRRKYMLQ